MAIAVKARIARHVAITTAGFLAERAAGRKPSTLDDIPAGAQSLTRGWLTAALCSGVAGAEVVAFTLGERDDGTTSRRLLTVSYNAEGDAAGLPRALFAKSTGTYRSRVMLKLIHGFRNEGEFYARIRPDLDIEAPRAYHVSYDETSGRSMFLLEDVTAARGAEFGSPLRYVDRAAAESMVRQMATYHAAYWDSPRLVGFAHLLTSKGFQDNLDAMVAFEKRSLVGLDRTSAFAPPELLRRRREIYPAVERSMELSVRGPLTLCHYDTHQGNWYKAADGRMGQHDWQATVRGRWACDVAYALSSGLTIDDRRSWERDLLDLYLEELRSAGVAEVPRSEDAFLEYRQQMFHPLVFWLFTIGQGRLNPDMQPRDVCEENCRRMEQAIVDLDCFDALETEIAL